MSSFSLLPFIFSPFLLPGFCFIYLSLPMSAVCYCKTLFLETWWEFKLGCFRLTAFFFFLLFLTKMCAVYLQILSLLSFLTSHIPFDIHLLLHQLWSWTFCTPSLCLWYTELILVLRSFVLRLHTFQCVLYSLSLSPFSMTLPSWSWTLGSLQCNVIGNVKLKVKVIPQQAWTDPRGSGSVKAPDFRDVRHYKDGRSSAIGTGRLYPRRKPLVLIFRGWVDPRAHGSVGGSHGKNPQWHHRESIPRPSD